jgi:glycine dehydrogenase subunit 2
MLTNPNTLGLFHGNIKEVAKLVHEAGGLLYYDGANLNALMGHAKPGDMGFDVVHYNVHKTLSVPHGGGGPGAGPIGVREDLVPFLPGPRVVKEGGAYTWKETPESIGRVTAFQGNYLALLRTWVYIRNLGGKGLSDVSSDAVMNANYMLAKLKNIIPPAFDQFCMHEFVLSPVKLYEETHVNTLNIAKRLIDYGYHPPTIYFPLIVKEAMMIEPTETESKETLDAFIEALTKIVEEAKTNPELVQGAPHTTPVKKLNDTLAARKPDLNYFG